MHKCEQEIDETVRHRRPFHVGQRLQRPRRGVQQARKHLGEATRGHDARLAEPGFAADTAVQSVRCDRQHDRAHVALEYDAPVAVPGQNEQMAGGNDPMAPTCPQHDAILDRQQHDRQAAGGMRQRRHAMTSALLSRKCVRTRSHIGPAAPNGNQAPAQKQA